MKLFIVLAIINASLAAYNGEVSGVCVDGYVLLFIAYKHMKKNNNHE